MITYTSIKESLVSLTENKYIRGIFLMVLFGGLSNVFGLIRFNIPGVEGGVTDLREVTIILSVIYLPHWIYYFGVSALNLITNPPDGSLMSSFVFQLTGMFFVYFVHKYLVSKIRDYVLMGLSWAVLVVLTYIFALLPVMLATNIAAGLVVTDHPFRAYIDLAEAVQFEMFVTAVIVAFFVVSRNMRLQLRQKNTELTAAKELAEQSDAIKTAFLQNISHEVRTPMNVIRGSTELILGGELNEDESAELHDNLQYSSDRLLKILDQIIEFSKIEAGTSFIEYSRVKIADVLTRVDLSAKEFRRIMDKEQLTFHMHMENEMEKLDMETDPSMLERILVYLIENAYKFTEAGSVTLQAECLGTDFIRFIVKDTGIGIPAEIRQKVFERFYQADTFTNGVGLSLSLTQKMAELMGGSVSIKDQSGKGTAMMVILPLERA